MTSPFQSSPSAAAIWPSATMLPATLVLADRIAIDLALHNMNIYAYRADAHPTDGCVSDRLAIPAYRAEVSGPAESVSEIYLLGRVSECAGIDFFCRPFDLTLYLPSRDIVCHFQGGCGAEPRATSAYLSVHHDAFVLASQLYLVLMFQIWPQRNVFSTPEWACAVAALSPHALCATSGSISIWSCI